MYTYTFTFRLAWKGTTEWRNIIKLDSSWPTYFFAACLIILLQDYADWKALENTFKHCEMVKYTRQRQVMCR
jgi:hypothetical protein